MTHLGAAEGFGLDRRGFLELERGFLGDGKTSATADDHQLLAVAQGVDGVRPILFGRLAQAIGQRTAGVQQVGFLVPVADQQRAGAEGGDKALGRGHTEFRPGAQRHMEFAGGFQGRVFGIHQRDAQGAALAQQAQAVDQVRALARLREAERDLAADLQRRVQQGHHRHRQRRHRNAHVLHGQVGEVARGVVGTAASDSHRHVRG